jgi:hypothetical protein
VHDSPEKLAHAERGPFSTLQAIIMMPLTWAAEALLVGWLWAFWAGIAMAAAAPATGCLALMFHEREKSFWSEIGACLQTRIHRRDVAELRNSCGSIRDKISALAPREVG